MISTNTFLQGIFAFTGEGLDRFAPVGPGLTHNVPDGRLCQALYFRGGNSADDLVVAALLRDGALMRLFPIGAKVGRARAAAGGRGHRRWFRGGTEAGGPVRHLGHRGGRPRHGGALT